MDADLAQLPVDAFLDRLAARAPIPGGGAVAAATQALGAALGRMVVAYSIGKNTDAETKTRLEDVAGRLLRTDQLARALMSRDAQAYEAMTAARKTESDDDGEAYQRAVLEGLVVPMEVAAAASATLACLNACQASLSRYLLADLGATAVLCDSAARAARYMVLVNASELKDLAVRDRVLANMDQMVHHCGERRASLEAFVCERL